MVSFVYMCCLVFDLVSVFGKVYYLVYVCRFSAVVCVCFVSCVLCVILFLFFVCFVVGDNSQLPMRTL